MSDTVQLTSTAGMSADEIAAAAVDGRLNAYLRTPNSGRTTAADKLLRVMTPEQIAAALEDGTLDMLLAARPGREARETSE
jgi:hypothetical protein